MENDNNVNAVQKQSKCSDDTINASNPLENKAAEIFVNNIVNGVDKAEAYWIYAQTCPGARLNKKKPQRKQLVICANRKLREAVVLARYEWLRERMAECMNSDGITHDWLVGMVKRRLIELDSKRPETMTEWGNFAVAFDKIVKLAATFTGLNRAKVESPKTVLEAHRGNKVVVAPPPEKKQINFGNGDE